MRILGSMTRIAKGSFRRQEFDEPLDLDSDPVWTWSDGGLTEGHCITSNLTG